MRAGGTPVAPSFQFQTDATFKGNHVIECEGFIGKTSEHHTRMVSANLAIKISP